MWPRFVPGTLGWRHSSVEMLFILMEGGSSGKARCLLSINLPEKPFIKLVIFFVPGYWGAKWLRSSDGNWRDGEKHQNSDQEEEQVESGGFETNFCVNKVKLICILGYQLEWPQSSPHICGKCCQCCHDRLHQTPNYWQFQCRNIHNNYLPSYLSALASHYLSFERSHLAKCFPLDWSNSASGLIISKRLASKIFVQLTKLKSGANPRPNLWWEFFNDLISDFVSFALCQCQCPSLVH